MEGRAAFITARHLVPVTFFDPFSGSFSNAFVPAFELLGEIERSGEVEILPPAFVIKPREDRLTRFREGRANTRTG